MSSFTILTYSSRSGSTYLAREVARQFDVVVVPEFQSAYPALSHPPGTVLRPDQIRYLLERDRQLHWVEEQEVNELLAAGPVSPGHFVRWVADCFRAREGAASTDYLVKLGGLPLTWPQVREHLPGVRGLNVVRDGRAVVNSLMSASSPYLGGSLDMGYGDPVWSARTWVRDIRAQSRCTASFPDSFKSYRYEDLVKHLDETVGAIGCDQGWRSAEEARTFAVTPAERAIHSNIDGPALQSRIRGWETELPREDRVVVEAIAGDDLRRLGYDDHLDVPIGERQWVMARARLVHVRRQGKGWYERLRRMKSPRDFADRVRRRAAQQRAWRS